ncbi:peptidyl-tRNA hydrolase 2, mitochondrial isoform X2 [Strongylocentrotus purpuratus]|uniref:peptidyl-tRNA hydrolase n=1 Tax=Strongylocentrotus purpuratus TaxID=7668 RepID=A0A7M7RCQ0_STRPU|nr:peptidyl-tRNA hydrolase 2, mitochondrial isoform X2 [Strongylocentrotus purpuratus]|eukprot:XP_780704.2 PREDICTED: peptidyl-tRNA hydrolase 2, mitochondrial isoform X2 [Strongylocentrotus purpuratus]
MPRISEYFTPLTVNVLFSMGAGVLMGWFIRGKFQRQHVLRAQEAARSSMEGTPSVMSDSGEYKLVLVVRNDLKMGKGKVAAQCSHATLGCFKKGTRIRPEWLKNWEVDGQPKVVLKVQDEQSLLVLSGQATRKGLPTSIIQDAGRTQIAPGSKTVLGIGPGPAELIDEVTGDLKLF